MEFWESREYPVEGIVVRRGETARLALERIKMRDFPTLWRL
jgi:hypothetical protein